MKALFGDSIMDLKYYWLREVELDGIPLIVSRTGWSSELGYELYLRDESRGDELWEKIMAAGEPFGLKPGHTSSIRRIEGGMLSYHADADINTNPYELGFDRLVNLDIEADFIGKAALRLIKEKGVTRTQVGLIIDGDPLKGPNTSFWAIKKDGVTIGKVTSAVYSPRLEKNIALAMVAVEHANLGAKVDGSRDSRCHHRGAPFLRSKEIYRCRLTAKTGTSRHVGNFDPAALAARRARTETRRIFGQTHRSVQQQL
jgi:aminomethyltransferase